MTKSPGIVLTIVLWSLFGAVMSPLLVVAMGGLFAFHPRVPDRIQLADGSAHIGLFIERSKSSIRFLEGIHSAGVGPRLLSVPLDSVVSLEPQPSAWAVEREDGPLVVGNLLSVKLEEGQILSGSAAETALQTFPPKLRMDRIKLARSLRDASGDSLRGSAVAREWNTWRARDTRQRAVFSSALGDTVSVRLSGVLRASSGRASSWGSKVVQFGSQWWQFLSLPVFAWGGGGIQAALTATFASLLAMLVLAAPVAICLAIWMREFSSRGKWVIRLETFLDSISGVPGVVWGAAGLAVFVQGLGPWIDRHGQGTGYASGGWLWASITLAALSLPHLVASTHDALDRVPDSWRVAGRAAGGTPWQIFLTIVWPQAFRQVARSMCSGLARAASQTAPLLLTGAVRFSASQGGFGENGFPEPSGGFAHLGAMVFDPPWSPIETQTGMPRLWATMLVLTGLCLALELLGNWFARSRKS